MKPPAEIVLRLQSVDEILLARHPSFYCKGKLNKDAEEFIINEASAFSRRSPITLTISRFQKMKLLEQRNL